MRIRYLNKQLCQQPEEPAENKSIKEPNLSSGVEIIEYFIENQEVKSTKEKDESDHNKYVLSTKYADGFRCIAGKNDETILIQSPIIELIKYDDDGEDRYEKLLHFCESFNYSNRIYERLRCYITDYQGPDDEEQCKYIMLYVEYLFLGIFQSGLKTIFDNFHSRYLSISEYIIDFCVEELNMVYDDGSEKVLLSDNFHYSF